MAPGTLNYSPNINNDSRKLCDSLTLNAIQSSGFMVIDGGACICGCVYSKYPEKYLKGMIEYYKQIDPEFRKTMAIGCEKRCCVLSKYLNKTNN
ncbi:MAG: hypothetical protein WC679_14180 [Bacteroidales bacterium]|jgi:hypothetical protein